MNSTVIEMNNKQDISIPAHLRELINPTPSGFAKLLAAWDGLGVETQILLISEIKRNNPPDYLMDRLRKVALKNPNVYIRYLAAKDFYFSEDDEPEKKEILNLITNDPDPLIRFCFKEEDHILRKDLDDPKTFFEMPQAARLATVRCLTGYGKEIANLITYAVEHPLKSGVVTEIELFEILADYVCKNEFKERFSEESYDGWTEYDKGKEIESLWNLVLKVPPRISHLLIHHLPPKGGLKNTITENVLENMTDNQLSELFQRPDIDLKELRKETFLKSEIAGTLSWAAVLHNFDFSYTEFAEILARPEKDKKEILANLTYANDLSLCIYDALYDAVKNSDMDTYITSILMTNPLERKFKTLQGSEKEYQLRELKLYRLAKQTVPWKKDEKGYSLPEELKVLEECVIEGDTWKTFMGFSEKWAKKWYSVKTLQKYLPTIFQLEEIAVEEEDVERPVELAERIEDKLSKILSTLGTGSDGEKEGFAEALVKLATYATVSQEKAKEEFNYLKKQLSDLQNSLKNYKLLVVAIIVLAAILLLFRR